MSKPSFTGETIWIIGASSGIGRELAIHLDSLGASLILSARTEDALHSLASQLTHPTQVIPLDIMHATEVTQAFTKVATQISQVDRVILMSALYEPAPIVKMDLDFASTLVDVNLKGVFYTTKAALTLFQGQSSGQIAVCGSIAGYFGLPIGQPYSATKAAVINYMESLYNEAPKHIDIKLISPGFVETPLTDKNEFDMPFIISPEVAAKTIAKGLRSKRFELHFPKRMTVLFKAMGTLNYRLLLPMIKLLVK